MGGVKKSKFWANDEEGMDAPLAPSKEVIKGDKPDTSNKDSSSSSESIDGDDDETDESSVKEAKDKPQPVSDMDFLRSRQTAEENLEEREPSSSSEEDGTEGEKQN
jgi:hypothetical protein